ncbi:retrovirus-related pol polyprotein from transposon TNT 1-94, partial [Tanacetum coccineum]
MVRQCPKPKRKKDATWFRDRVILVEAQGNDKVLNEEELEFLTDPGIIEGPVTQTIITHNAAYQADNLDAYDSDCDDFSTAKAVLMANLSSYRSDVLSEVKLLEERQNVDLGSREKLIIDDFEKEINSLKQTLSEQLKEKESLTTTFNVFKNESNEKEAKNIDNEIALEKKVFYDNNLQKALGFQNLFYLKKAQQISPMLYDGNVIAKETNVISIADSEETLMLEEASRSKMLLKQSDPMVLEKKVNIKPVNYSLLNQLSKDFGKHFVPQKELSTEQAFWFQMSNPSNESYDPSPVKMDVPTELPKVSLVNTSLKKLKSHLTKFDSVVKTRITPSALTEGEWGFEHTKAVFINEIILFLKSLKDIFNVFDKDLLNKITELQIVFDQMEAVVQQYSIDKRCLEIANKQNMNASVNVKSSTAMNDSVKYLEMCNKCLELKAELIKQHNMVEKDEYNKLSKRKGFGHNSIKNDLRKLKGKNTVDNAAQVSNSTTIALGMYKLDPVILAPRDKNNREIHKYYLKHTMEQASIFKEIVEQAKSLNPLDSASYTACKYVKLIQELLGYVRDTCPDIQKPSEKLVEVTPMNKVKKVRFSEPLTSSNNIKQVESSKTSNSNTPVLSSTGVKCSTSTCRSKPTSNKRNDRILQPSISNIKNKVEAQPSKVNKKNRVVEPICDANVKHTMLNANSQLICVTCKQCMFDANHDVCFLDVVNEMNMGAQSKSKSNKKSQPHNIWKPTGKIFSKVGLKWKPTRRTFTLVGNACPLTRITSTKIVPRKNTPPHLVETPKPELKFYSRRPKHVKNIGLSKKDKIVEPKIANNSEPNHSWGSYATNIPSSSSLVNDRLSRLFSDLEVAFRKHTCFIRNLEGVDLLSGSQETNLYTLSIGDMMIHGLVRGLPKLKFEKDHLCSACAMGKSKKHLLKPKSKDTNQEKLYLLHMDLYGPMQVASVNARKNIRTDNRTEFVNQTQHSYYESVCISHETSVARTPQQNGVTKRRNHTLVEAARIMLIYAKAQLFLWAEAVATACKLQAKANIGIFIGYAPNKKAYCIYNRRPALHEMTLATPSSGLVPNPTPSTLVASPDPVVEAPAPIELTNELHDLEVAHMSNDPYFGIPIPKIVFEESSSSDVIHTTVHPDAPISEHPIKWIKDHPIQSIIGELSRPVSTRLQLHEQALFCYYDAFLTSVEPKTYKEVLTHSCCVGNKGLSSFYCWLKKLLL